MVTMSNCVTGPKMKMLNISLSHLSDVAKFTGSRVFCCLTFQLLTACAVFSVKFLTITSCPLLPFFCNSVSLPASKAHDWGYLNEDGELGLAYQGLKQVARWLFTRFACAACVAVLPAFLHFLLNVLGYSSNCIYLVHLIFEHVICVLKLNFVSIFPFGRHAWNNKHFSS